MRIVKKNVYYCDHCKKKSLAAHAIKKHEGRCTNNPNRCCGLCERKSILDLIESYNKRFVMHPVIQEDHEGSKIGEYFNVEWIGEPVTLEEIRMAVENCPNCIFSILRQCKLNYECCELQAFDYKKEFQSYINEKNAEPEYWY